MIGCIPQAKNSVSVAFLPGNYSNSGMLAVITAIVAKSIFCRSNFEKEKNPPLADLSTRGQFVNFSVTGEPKGENPYRLREGKMAGQVENWPIFQDVNYQVLGFVPAESSRYKYG